MAFLVGWLHGLGCGHGREWTKRSRGEGHGVEKVKDLKGRGRGGKEEGEIGLAISIFS